MMSTSCFSESCEVRSEDGAALGMVTVLIKWIDTVPHVVLSDPRGVHQVSERVCSHEVC
jgi:hypothetical protein